MNAAAEGIDIERGKEALAKMGIIAADANPMPLGGPYDAEKLPAQQAMLANMKPAKKPRSDKGSKRPAKPEPAKAGATSEEISAGMKLATELALQIKAVPNRAVRRMIRELIALVDKWDTQ